MHRLGATAVFVTAALPAAPALAHGIAGPRVFVATLTIDDPAVADEASLPTFSWQQQPGSPVTGEYDLNFEFDKRITERFGFGINDGYTLLRTPGAPNRTGWQNVALTLKYQLIVNPEHEFMAALGVIRDFARTGSAAIDNDDVSATTPTIYWGKGLGDLPIGLFRPLAVTGTFGYQVADKELKSTTVVDPATGLPGLVFNNGIENRWVGGLSIQYSIPYLQSQVRDLGLPEFIGRLTPIVEVAWSSPATHPHGTGTQYLLAPGVIYTADFYQIGLEALVPGNGQAGHNVGVIAQFHLFFDDLFPKSLGKPLLRW